MQANRIKRAVQALTQWSEWQNLVYTFWV